MVSDMKKENNLNKIIGDDVSLMGKKEHVKILEVDKLYKSNDFVDPEVVDKTEKICYAMASSGAWAIFSKRRHADSMLTELQSGAMSDANKKSVKGIILECKNVYALRPSANTVLISQKEIGVSRSTGVIQRIIVTLNTQKKDLNAGGRLKRNPKSLINQ